MKKGARRDFKFGKKPSRDRHAVAESIKESYQSRPLVSDKVSKTVLVKKLRKKAKA